jgi:hypothetical protein
LASRKLANFNVVKNQNRLTFLFVLCTIFAVSALTYVIVDIGHHFSSSKALNIDLDETASSNFMDEVDNPAIEVSETCDTPRHFEIRSCIKHKEDEIVARVVKLNPHCSELNKVPDSKSVKSLRANASLNLAVENYTIRRLTETRENGEVDVAYEFTVESINTTIERVDGQGKHLKDHAATSSIVPKESPERRPSFWSLIQRLRSARTSV